MILSTTKENRSCLTSWNTKTIINVRRIQLYFHEILILFYRPWLVCFLKTIVIVLWSDSCLNIWCDHLGNLTLTMWNESIRVIVRLKDPSISMIRILIFIVTLGDSLENENLIMIESIRRIQVLMEKISFELFTMLSYLLSIPWNETFVFRWAVVALCSFFNIIISLNIQQISNYVLWRTSRFLWFFCPIIRTVNTVKNISS